MILLIFIIILFKIIIYIYEFNHTLEISSQKDDINNKLNTQLQEQFDKVNKLINDEELNLSNTQIENIKRIKALINNILKYIKREKIQ